MSIFGNGKSIKCPKCGYVCSYVEKCPDLCPQCSAGLNDPELIKELSSNHDNISETNSNKVGENLIKSMKNKNICKNSPDGLVYSSKKERQKKKAMISSLLSTSPYDPKKEKEKKNKKSKRKHKDDKEDIFDDLNSISSNKLNSSYTPAYTPALDKSKDVQEIKISKSKIKVKGVKVKKKITHNLNLDQFAVVLNDKAEREYLKFMGVVSKERKEIYSSNSRFNYLLELGANLEFIATSILDGVLDRMSLTSPDTGLEEVTFFFSHKDLVYVVYGYFPDKKAVWLLNQLKINLQELLLGQNPDQLEKMELYSIKKEFDRKIKYILEEYIKLQNVFSDNKIQSLDDYLRIDYFGLSYESVGVISQLITSGQLEIKGLPPMDPNMADYEEEMQELKESLVTAKIEAIAANTMANTQMMPDWITVKLGYQHYRYLIFSSINNYYIYMLGEGNLTYLPPLLSKLHEILKEQTRIPFSGDLARFSSLGKVIRETIISNNAKINNNRKN